jgi:branched-chain amino acid transport system substrate-binding protein
MYRKGLAWIAMIIFIFGIAGLGWAAEPIKVGAPLCLTGPYAGDGLGYFRGLEMAVDELNKGGGLLDRPLEIVKFDTQDFAPERVMQAADQLVGREKVHAIHAGWAGWGQDVRSYGKYDVPAFVWDSSINSVSVFREDPKKYSNWFQLNATEKQGGTTGAFFMAGLPYNYPNRKAVVISTDDSWGLEVAKGLTEAAKDADWEIALTEVVPYGTREWGPILTKIRAIKPAWIWLEIVSSPDLITFYRQFLKAPTNSLLFFGYGMTLPDFLPNLGQEGNGIMGETITIPEPAPTPESAAWVKSFTDRYDAPPAAGSFAVYTGVMIWAEAVKKIGKVDDYKAINNYLAKTKFRTLEGRDVWFDEDHKISNTVWPPNWMQIQDGKMVTLALTGNDLKVTVPYKDFKFQTPPWIKK